MLFGWEVIMTFVLVSVVYAVAIGDPSFGAMGPLAVGLSLLALVFAGQPIACCLGPALPCPVFPALPCPALPCPALPFPSLPFAFLPKHNVNAAGGQAEMRPGALLDLGGQRQQGLQVPDPPQRQHAIPALPAAAERHVEAGRPRPAGCQ